MTLKVGSMVKLIFSLLALLSFRVASAVELKVGDILLQPMNCWSCTLIEAEEGSIYSHMGIVVKTKPEVMIAEALGKVRLISLPAFLARTEKNQKVSVRRIDNENAVKHFQNYRMQFLILFQNWFDNHEYDSDFLWDNVGTNGEEKFYCSEMITKLLKAFIGLDFPVKKMHFNVNRDMWIQYFRGTPPDGKWGNAPGDFEKSEWFYEVGEL